MKVWADWAWPVAVRGWANWARPIDLAASILNSALGIAWPNSLRRWLAELVLGVCKILFSARSTPVGTGQMSIAETGQMSTVGTGQMSAAETGQTSTAETGQMSAVDT